MIGLSVPTFVIGPLCVLAFAIHLGWFSASGWYFAADRVLPSLVLGLAYAAPISRLTRGGMLEVLHQDYIRTARAKGASEIRVVFKHALRGGLLPVVAYLGPAIAGILTGLVRHRDDLPDPRPRPRIRHQRVQPRLHAGARHGHSLRRAHHGAQPPGRRRAGLDEPESPPRMSLPPDSLPPLAPGGEAVERGSFARARRVAAPAPEPAGGLRRLHAASSWRSPASLGPLLSPYGYEETRLDLGATAPGLQHWLGTDVLGRDLLVRLLYGGRISLAVGLSATVVALTIGVVYGAVAGFFGGKLDAVMMRAVDILYSLPFTIFVILLMVFFGRNIILLFVAIGAVEWLTMARIVRGQVMSIKRMEFIEAARALGFGRRRILFRHILPNVLGPIIVYTTLTIPSVMLLEAFLSFLGLGVQPPMSSWGVLIKDGAEKMEEFPWLLLFPGTVFSLTLFSLNFLGDGLRDALDVRSVERLRWNAGAECGSIARAPCGVSDPIYITSGWCVAR